MPRHTGGVHDRVRALLDAVMGKRCPEHIGFRFDSGRLPQVMWQAGLQ